MSKHKDIREDTLKSLQSNSGSPVYASLLMWLESEYEISKERLVSASVEQLPTIQGECMAKKDLLTKLKRRNTSQ